jgi:hypothetical protein
VEIKIQLAKELKKQHGPHSPYESELCPCKFLSFFFGKAQLNFFFFARHNSTSSRGFGNLINFLKKHGVRWLHDASKQKKGSKEYGSGIMYARKMST